MKGYIIILTNALFVIAGCVGSQQSGSQNDGFITVAVTASYPKKELILQDFMEVEYIPLESAKEFLCQGIVLAVGKEFILIKNQVNDGDIFVFDRTTGKALRKINHLGKSGEEYTFIGGITLDEDNNEMFVNDLFAKRFLVYDLHGIFKRSFYHAEGAMYDCVFNYDQNNLICYDSSFKARDGDAEKKRLFYTIISKQDGSIIRKIQIPVKKIKSTAMILGTAENGRMVRFSTPSSDYPIILDQGNWILMESSSDTVYKYLPDNNLRPFIVRTPSIQSMNPEIFLFMNIFTDRYCFMEIVKKQEGFPRTDLMYDRQEKAIFKYTVYNDDYSGKSPVYMKSTPINDEIAFGQKIEAHTLVADYQKGRLKGKLKEIAAGLGEEDNPVIMLIKHKK